MLLQYTTTTTTTHYCTFKLLSALATKHLGISWLEGLPLHKETCPLGWVSCRHSTFVHWMTWRQGWNLVTACLVVIGLIDACGCTAVAYSRSHALLIDLCPEWSIWLSSSVMWLVVVLWSVSAQSLRGRCKRSSAQPSKCNLQPVSCVSSRTKNWLQELAVCPW